MTVESLALMLEAGLAGCNASDRIHVYDAAADLAHHLQSGAEDPAIHLKLSLIAESSREMASRLRDLDRAQLDFLALLRSDLPRSGGNTAGRENITNVHTGPGPQPSIITTEAGS